MFDKFSEAESLVEFAHQNQAAVGGDAGTLKIDLERGIEGELKRADLVSHPLGTDPRSIFIAFTPA